jgi:rhodanese-related sulfurtransferase
MSQLCSHNGVLLALVVMPLVVFSGCSTEEFQASRDTQTELTSDVAKDEEILATISPQELADRIEAGEAPLVLDVRSEEEFAEGHIPGAVHIPHDQLEARLAELSITKDDEVVVHCQGGRRAELCQNVLRDAGFTKVLDLEGHFGEWQKLELPEE